MTLLTKDYDYNFRKQKENQETIDVEKKQRKYQEY